MLQGTAFPPHARTGVRKAEEQASTCLQVHGGQVVPGVAIVGVLRRRAAERLRCPHVVTCTMCHKCKSTILWALVEEGQAHRDTAAQAPISCTRLSRLRAP